MNNQHPVENINFYQELINKFFHPQSYFYYCINKYLQKGSSIFANLDKSTYQITSNVITFLLTCDHPVQELQELNKIEGFKNFYQDIEDELMRLNISTVDQDKTKQIIQDIAFTTLEKLIKILSQTENRNVLNLYLELKNKLNQIFHDPNNGSDNNGKEKKERLKQEEKPHTEVDNQTLTSEESSSLIQNRKGKLVWHFLKKKFCQI